MGEALPSLLLAGKQAKQLKLSYHHSSISAQSDSTAWNQGLTTCQESRASKLSKLRLRPICKVSVSIADHSVLQIGWHWHRVAEAQEARAEWLTGLRCSVITRGSYGFLVVLLLSFWTWVETVITSLASCSVM